ncbi:50S ribosomal protein L22, partial [Candidatus Micrarchaeota archaeon]|nr:50S ribosomal protein L22 [Candidatus Micrarchaeota archaeon]
MGLYSYSILLPKEARVAKAQIHDVNASYKDLGQVLAAIKGKTVAQATQVLDLCISKKKAVPFKKFAKHLGHRSELGGHRGKYPVKEARIALQLLNNAVANADAKGLDKNALVVYGAASHKQNVFMRNRRYWAGGIVIGYGRQAFASKYVTCWAELVLVEKVQKQ